jgi:putative membrane protein
MPRRASTVTSLSFHRQWAAAGGLSGLSLAWIGPLPALARDLFAVHMFQHLLVMNVAALLLGAAMRNADSIATWRAALPLATVLQAAALSMWHLPAAFAAAHDSVLIAGLMHVSLLCVSTLFWAAVLSPAQTVWRAIFSLLATAKVLCLAGALFIFSRRALYSEMGNPEVWGLSPLEDQQLAGLLMISFCALIPVGAAIVLFERWLASVEPARPERWNRDPDVAFRTR